MKLTSPSPFTLLLAVSFAVSCASAADDTGIGVEPDAGADGKGGDSGPSTTDSGSGFDTKGGTDSGWSSDGGVCTSHCTSDYDCSSTCAAPPSGSYNCCDTATGVCYLHSGFCPTGGTDSGGVDTAPY